MLEGIEGCGAAAKTATEQATADPSTAHLASKLQDAALRNATPWQTRMRRVYE
jgi:hypothetical protein